MTGARKHTIAGIVPVEWDAKLIKNCCDVVRGASPRPAGDPRYFDGDHLPWITVADVTGTPGMYLNGTRTKLTEEGANFTRLIPPATLIITNSGATLGVPKITRELSGANDGIAVFLNLKDVSKECLFYILESKTKYFRNELAPGVGQPNLNTELLGDVAIPIPPPGEQDRIVDALSTWDAAIQKTEQLIAAKAKRKAGLMAELLTGRRRHARFQSEWRSWHLGELFQERVENNRNDLPLLSITREEGAVPRDGLDRKNTSSEDKSKYLRICPGDIGYNTMRMWQGVSALSRHEGIVSPAYTVCIPGPEIDGAFASYLFKLPEVIHLFYRYSQGLTSDTWNLKFHRFATIRVRIPEPEEQIEIATILAVLDEELALIKLQREALAHQKRGLMQKLLTGQWRLPVQEEAN